MKLLLQAGLVLGCMAIAETARADWYAIPVARIGGFKTPESVLPLPDSGLVIVSNVETATRGYWKKDERGFLSQLQLTLPDKISVHSLEWVRMADGNSLNAPKGLCFFKGKLYVADIDRVAEIPLKNPKEGRIIRVLRALQLNDVATDGRYVYVSDTAGGCVYRLNLLGYGHKRIPAPLYINGITFHKGKLYGVGWQTHEIYLLDPEGRNQAVPLGVAGAFWSLDGIEILDDHTIIVSDFTRGRVAWIGRDRKVHTLVEMPTPADIGVDRKHMLLYVPSFEKDEVRVFRLTTEPPRVRSATRAAGTKKPATEHGPENGADR